MKRIIFLAVFLLSFSLGIAQARDYKPATGSVDLDIKLGDINLHAAGDTDNFITSLAASYNVRVGDVRYHLEGGMHAGDIYMAARLSNMTEHSFDYVTKMYNRNRAHGWGHIAKSLGIKPGSREFHALKDSSKMKKHKRKKHPKGMKKHNKGKGKKGKH